MGPQILKRFDRCNIESITAWYGNSSASDRKALQRVVRMAQYITGAKLPAIQDLYTRQCQRMAQKLSTTPATPVIDCSLCYRMHVKQYIAPSLEPKSFSTAFTLKP